MKYVVIDLEMNPIAAVHTAEREICKLEVIEIGAVLLDEKYQEIGSFVTLVKPREYSCAMKSHFRKFGNQMSGSGNHLCNYASLLA